MSGCDEHYVLLEKERGRVSRSRRVGWLLHQLVPFHLSPSPDLSDIKSINNHSPSSNDLVLFISKSYSLILLIDMTDSMLLVSNETFSVKSDEAKKALEKVLLNLIQPIKPTDGSQPIMPHITLSIIAYSKTRQPVNILYQGVKVTEDNVNEIIHHVKSQLHQLENVHRQSDDDKVGEPDASLEGLLKAGILSMQLLPQSTIKGLILFTDGVGGFTTPTSMHNVVNQLRSANISCWVVLCGRGVEPLAPLGAMSDTLTLQFITQSANGAIIDPNKILVDWESSHVNPMHRCIMMWSIQLSSWQRRVKEVQYSETSLSDQFVPLTTYIYQRCIIKSPLLHTVSCRVREGFFITSITVSDETEVVMRYLWQPDITIEYCLHCSPSHVILTLSFIAPYPFIRDFLVPTSDASKFTQSHGAALRRFKQTLKSLSHSDEVLSHLLSYHSYNEFPQSIMDKLPLFHLSPNQSKPSLSIEDLDKKYDQLASYWKSFCTMDTLHWSRWLQTHKIALILRHDGPLPSGLFHPSSTGRYPSIYCRVSSSKLFTMLRHWATAVLLDNQCYVKLCNDDNIDYLCLLRVVQFKTCILIHVGFLEGTPAVHQDQQISSLCLSINNLKISIQIPPSNQTGYKKTSISHQNCATVINKQIQKVLISYDAPPSDDPFSSQWDYMRKISWQWKLPAPHSIYVMALLLVRLNEGYHIAHTSNGIITLIMELNVKQPSSALPFPCLLQYVIFPLSSDGMFYSQLWVEPQYGSVDHPSPPYLIDTDINSIHYKIHSVDIELLTRLSTFFEYCPLPEQPSFDPDISVNSVDMKSFQLVEIQFELSSLYHKASVCALILPTFTDEESQSFPITLDNCSVINRTFHSRFLELIQHNLSCLHNIPQTDHALLISRLTDSNKLQSFVSLYCTPPPSSGSSSLLWRSFAIGHDELLSLLFIPCFLSSTHRPHPSTCIPLVLMSIDESSLSSINPSTTDVFIDKVSSDRGEEPATPPMLLDLVNQLEDLHKRSYLHSIHAALSNHGYLPPPSDLRLGLMSCGWIKESIDMSPLVLATCDHFTSDMSMSLISHLLSSMTDARSSSPPALSLETSSSATSHKSCHVRISALSGVFYQFMSDVGFTSITNMCGHYWHQSAVHSHDKDELWVTSPSPPPSSSQRSLADESDDDEMSHLEPLISPTSDHCGRSSFITDSSPLFLSLTYSVADGNEHPLDHTSLPLCINKLLSDSSIELRFHLKMYYLSNDNDLHAVTVNALKSKFVWLMKDELLARARELIGNEREGMGVWSDLLQSLAAHVQSSYNKHSNCTFTQESIKFVFGTTNSMNQFIQQLQEVSLDGYAVHRSDSYFYFTPVVPAPATPMTPPYSIAFPHHQRSSVGRCYTPSPSHIRHPISHRRSISWCASSTHQPHPPPSISSSIDTTTTGPNGCGYDGSRSNSVTTPSYASVVEEHDMLWILLRVLPTTVEVYLHQRYNIEGIYPSMRNVCSQVVDSIRRACKRTNQWHLLKDLLDSRVCSDLLLPESLSDEWVGRTVMNQSDIITIGGETFSPQQFECDCQWRQHITPHWRLRSMKNQPALKITRNALDAFAINNRIDVYVLQDVLEGGDEMIFYLKITESLFESDDVYGMDDDSRCDTRATDGPIDNISNFSQDTNEPLAPMNRFLSGSTFSLPKSYESIVLELYGICPPSDTLKSRLQRVIQLKLDDAALEIMCSSYTRNQRLRLSPSDVEFLQPSCDQSSEVMSVLLPKWITSFQTVLYYLLQQMSAIYLNPQYSPADDKVVPFNVPPDLSASLAHLPPEICQDYLFLYIRPVNRGRGMALISVSLVDPEGRVLPPQLPLLQPSTLLTPPSFAEATSVEVVELYPHIGSAHSIAFHIWERGNASLATVRDQLVTCVRYSLMDALFEIHYLHLPVASLSPSEIEERVSPGLFQRHSPGSSDRYSYVNVSLDEVSTEEEDWDQKERTRRIHDFKDSLIRQAALGLVGHLESHYIVDLNNYMAEWSGCSSPSISHASFTCPSRYFINQTLLDISNIFTQTFSNMTFNLFESSLQYDDYIWTSYGTLPTSNHSSYIIIGRNLDQWKESSDPSDPTQHLETSWSQSMRFIPLGSWKVMDKTPPPLGVAARKMTSFIPRHQLLLASFIDRKFSIWMYNVNELCVKKLRDKFKHLFEWQMTRYGFVQHLLHQKMGLFHHMSGSEMTTPSFHALKYCTTIKNVTNLIQHTAPVDNEYHEKTSQAQFELESFYHGRHPSSSLWRNKSQDPVSCHGQQFCDMFHQERELVKHRELLGKVFESWEQHGIDYSAPISSDTISKLKRTSRLFHFCHSRLFLFSEDDTPSSPNEADWRRKIKDAFLKDYIEYLQTLKFHSINERPAANKSPKSVSSPTHHSNEHLGLYKSLQRSWTNGGIMLIELLFTGCVFNVKLYSIECSRLSKRHIPSNCEASGFFSQECSRMKDFIHVNSFTYDFHVKFIYDITLGRIKINGTINLHELLSGFCHHYTSSPNYIRNRICHDVLELEISVPMESLFKNIVSHCDQYDIQTIEMIQSNDIGGCGFTTTLYDVSLFINMATLGNITTPELSRILHDTANQYNIIILAVPNSDHSNSTISLSIYMILVNKHDKFPRLTVYSPLVGGGATTPTEDLDLVNEKQSELHLSVQSHRRKLGYGSLNTPTGGSSVVINESIINEEMKGLKRHFYNVIMAAQSHVKRNELWKRLLYGGRVEMSGLSCVEFQELLQLVTVVRIESVDHELIPLQKQSKKNYRQILKALEEKFNGNFRSYTSKDNTEVQYGVIINPDWQDMFVLMTLCDDSQCEGFHCVYRNPQKTITSAYTEPEQTHIANVINFACVCIWMDVINSTPSISHSSPVTSVKNKHH